MKYNMLIIGLCMMVLLSFNVFGVTITYDSQGNKIYTFTSSESFNVTSNMYIDFLIVGGGGNGGSAYRGSSIDVAAMGGGGAGGIVYGERKTLTPSNYNIVVGGAATNSSFNGYVAIAGSNGGTSSTTSPYTIGSLDGGSGAGGGYITSSSLGLSVSTSGKDTIQPSYVGVLTYGNKGGNATSHGGGGGGAGSIGETSGSKGGNGGAGVNFSITGSIVCYGGGGGGSKTPSSGGSGGIAICGGGAGANPTGGSYQAGSPATANTGGGGGGGGSNSLNAAGGSGGSGIVIIKEYNDSFLYNVSLNTPVTGQFITTSNISISINLSYLGSYNNNRFNCTYYLNEENMTTLFNQVPNTLINTSITLPDGYVANNYVSYMRCTGNNSVILTSNYIYNNYNIGGDNTLKLKLNFNNTIQDTSGNFVKMIYLDRRSNLFWWNDFSYWGNDSNNGLKNLINNTQTGVATNVTWTSDGARFNGINSYINTTIPLPSNFSVFVTFSIESIPSVDYKELITSRAFGDTSGSFSIQIYTERMRLLLWNGSGYTSNFTQPTGVLPTPTTEVGRVYTVGVVKNGNNFSLYSDGEYRNSVNFVNFPYTATKSLYLGGIGNLNTALNGTIHDVKIFNRSLSDEEVEILLNTGLYKNTSGTYPPFVNDNLNIPNESMFINNYQAVLGSGLNIRNFPITLSLWDKFNLTELLAKGQTKMIFTQNYNLSFPGFNLYMHNTTHKFTLVLSNGLGDLDTVNSASYNFDYNVSNLNDGTFHNLILTLYNDTQHTLWIDGIPYNSTYYAFNTSVRMVFQDKFYITTSRDTLREYYSNAFLDNIYIWNKSLSSSEVVYYSNELQDYPDISFIPPTTPNGGNAINYIDIHVIAFPKITELKNYTIYLYDNGFNILEEYSEVTSGTFVSRMFTELDNGRYYVDAVVWNEGGFSKRTVLKNITLDTVSPEIIVRNDFSNIRLKNNTAFQWNVSVNDWNVFGIEVTCRIGDIISYYDMRENINQSYYNYTNLTILSQPGIHTCNFSASDDHTDKEFNEESKITTDKLLGVIPVDQKLFDKIEGYVGDLDFSIDKTDYKSLETKIIKEYDRVSLEFINPEPLKKDEVMEVPVSIKCSYPYNAYKRNSNPRYKEHWVCSDGIKGYWIDGNTLERNVEVSSYYDESTEEIKLLYLTTGQKITMSSIGGLNFNSVEFNVTVDYWDYVNFYAYNQWNKSNINLFSVNITNSSGVTNNYTTTTGNVTVNLLTGNYNIRQTANGYVFGNLSSSHVVGNVASYNTSFWQSELRVRAIDGVLSSLIPGISMQANITTPLITNNTISLTGDTIFRTNNGSYSVFANMSNGEFTPSGVGSTGTIALGEQKTVDLTFSRMYYINLFREKTNLPFNFTESNTSKIEVTLQVICQDKVVSFNLNTSTKTLTGIDCDWTQANNPDSGWFISVRYPEADEYYYRFIFPNPAVSNHSAWLLEVSNGDTLAELEVSISDLSNNFDNGYLSAETEVSGLGYTEVIKQKVNIEKKVNFFLREGVIYRYFIYDDDGNRIDLSYKVAQTGTITVVQPNIAISDQKPSTIKDINFYAYLNDDKSVVYGVYNDNSVGGAKNLTATISKIVTNSSLNITQAIALGDYSFLKVYETSFYDVHNVTFNYSTFDPDETYVLSILVDHYNSSYDFERTQVIKYPSPWELEGFENASEDIKLWIATGTVIGTIMVGTVTSIEFIFPFALIITSVFLGYGWFDALPLIKTTTIAGKTGLGILIIIFSVMSVLMLYRAIKKRMA